MGVSCFEYRFQKPGPPFTASNTEKFNYPKESASSADLKDYPESHEMIGVHFQIRKRLYGDQKVKAAVEFYNDETGDLLWKGSFNVQSPSDAGHSYWDSYDIRFWIGHADWEINKAMHIRMECHLSGFPVGEYNWTKLMNIKDSSYVPPDPDPVVIKGKMIQFQFKDVSKWILLSPSGLTAKWIGGGIAKLQKSEYLRILMEKLANVIPLGYKLVSTEIDKTKLTLSLYFEEKGSVWVAVAIVAAVVGVLALFGLIVTSWKVFNWLKEKEQTRQEEEETEQLQNDNDLIKDLTDAGIIEDADDAVKVIEALRKSQEDEDKNESFFDGIKEILMYAFLMIIVVMLIQQMGKR